MITHTISFKNLIGLDYEKNFVSANHCQKGTNIMLYKIKTGIHKKNIREEVLTHSESIDDREVSDFLSKKRKDDQIKSKKKLRDRILEQQKLQEQEIINRLTRVLPRQNRDRRNQEELVESEEERERRYQEELERALRESERLESERLESERLESERLESEREREEREEGCSIS
jgi:hypothetical protein